MIENQGISKTRTLFLSILIICLIFGYILYLFNIQVINNMVYEKKAKEVTQRSKIIPAQRGQIYDRNKNTPLAMNIDSFAINYTPAELENISQEELIKRLALILGQSPQSLSRKFPKKGSHSFVAREIIDGIDYKTIVKLSENIEDFPGISWTSKPKRFYNQVGSFSHILGYVGNITDEELQVLYNQGYSTSSVLGKNGIEKQYDQILKGESGKKINTVDVKGRKMADGTDMIPPENGYDLVLTIDSRIQTLAQKALGKRKGSVVVLNPRNGELLALVSYPGFNPNLFNKPGPQNFGRLTLNPDFPFLNRAIQSSYAPASTFKIVLAAALLDQEEFDPNKKINCTGSMMLGNRKFYCHKHSGHGELDLKGALAESCNIYFGTMGVEVLGIDKIDEYAKQFGLGSLSGIDLQNEISGNIPTPAWKKQTYNRIWTGGDTLNASIGQGFVSTTPLQMANLMAAIVNDGVIYKPHLLKQIISPSTGAIIDEIVPEVLREAHFKSDTLRKLRQALRYTISDGSNNKLVILNNQVKIAGKTGTGEVGRQEHWHSWFVSYGPYTEDNLGDKLVVLTMVEASNKWEWWAPKAADIIYQGIYGNQTYEEVIKEMRSRRVWYSWDAHIEGDDEN